MRTISMIRPCQQLRSLTGRAYCVNDLSVSIDLTVSKREKAKKWPCAVYIYRNLNKRPSQTNHIQ